VSEARRRTRKPGKSFIQRVWRARLLQSIFPIAATQQSGVDARHPSGRTGIERQAGHLLPQTTALPAQVSIYLSISTTYTHTHTQGRGLIITLRAQGSNIRTHPPQHAPSVTAPCRPQTTDHYSLYLHICPAAQCDTQTPQYTHNSINTATQDSQPRLTHTREHTVDICAGEGCAPPPEVFTCAMARADGRPENHRPPG
jgi:hypothetical protein